MASTIAVTGSTGQVGGAVAAELANAGVAQRLLVRRPERAPQLAGATVSTCSYDDLEASTAAMAGADIVFMVSGAESATRLDEHRTFVDAAVAAGVRHIVYTSFFGAAPDATFTLARDHFFTEQHIEESGLDYTFLRDNFYSDVMELFAGDDGVIRGPAGSGRVSLVARADVARVAVRILSEPGPHVRKTYDLTGPEALSMAEVAATIAEVRGVPVSFFDESVDEAYASRARYGAPGWQNDAWVSTYTAIESGELSAVTDDVERLTGRQAMTLREVVANSGAPA